MAMHARSDVSAVSISPAHGGCGETHSRPVHQGAPAKLWTLECDKCETHLIKDAHWSRTLSGIPETPDEKAHREDQEQKGRLDQQNQTAEALAKLGSLGDLPAAIAQLAQMFANPEHAQKNASGVPCASCGVVLRPNAKFCAECGSKVVEAVSNPLPPIDLEALSLPQLKQLAEERGVPAKGNISKATLIARLQGE